MISYGNKILRTRVDQKMCSCSSGFWGNTLNPCDKERRSRNPVETTARPILTLAAVQLVEAMHVSDNEWGATLLHSFDLNNAFPKQ